MGFEPVEYVANLHVHTDYSDGTGPVKEVIAAAGEAGLDVLLINDHDTLAAKEDGYEGYHGRVLVLVGLEVSGPHNHYLVYGTKECPEYEWEKPQDFIDQVKEMGGIGFIAHPDEKGSPLSEGGRAFTWLDWTVKDFNGICIWNHSSSWKTRAMTYPSAIFHYFFRKYTLPGPPAETLAKWDEVGLTRRVAGIGGSDVHALRFKLLGLFNFCIFEYQEAFRTINTHLLLPSPLTGNLEADRAAVYEALAQGSCFISCDKLHRGEGFDFRLENGGERRGGQGWETTLEQGDSLAWKLPTRARVRVLRNGQTVFENSADQGSLPAPGPGVYRLEASLPMGLFGPRPWIFSNPVYIR